MILETIYYLDNLPILLKRKKIKNLNLSVRANREIILSVPYRCSLAYIHQWLDDRRQWIDRTLKKLEHQPQPIPLIAGATHYVWGKPHTLMFADNTHQIMNTVYPLLYLKVSHQTDVAKQQAALDAYYAHILKTAIPDLVQLHSQRMHTPQPIITIKKMKTRWGSCTPAKHAIRLNSELAKYPPQCVEYVLVHELAHFYQTGHGAAFVALMNQFLPDWRERDRLLKNKIFTHSLL